MVKRKVYLTLRTRGLVLGFFMPVLYQFLGTLITKVIIDNIIGNTFDDDDNKEKIIFLIEVQIIPSICCSLCYSFATTVFTANVVEEREKKLKYALNVMGCRTLPYWL
jgi:ATP-binding cassette subfamily A (ABC1) protein 3